MRLHLALVTTSILLSLASPVAAQLVPVPLPVDPLPIPAEPIPVPPIPEPIDVPPITVDPPSVGTPVTTPIDIPPIVIDPDVTDIVAPIIPDTVALPTEPIDLPTVGEVLELPDATNLVDDVGNAIDDVVAGEPITLSTGEQVIPLIDPETQEVVGTVDPTTGAIATPDGQVVGNVNNQGGSGGSGSGSGGSSSGGTASNSNKVTVDNRNTFIAIPQPALGSDSKTTTEVIEEIDANGYLRNRVLTTGYNRSVPTISISGGIVGGQGLGLIQLAIPLNR